MNADESNDGPFEISLPVWTIFNLQQNGYVAINEKSVGRYVPLFTDIDLAKRFIKACFGDWKHIITSEFSEFADLARDLKNAEKGGTKFVGIDPPAKPEHKGLLYPIAQFLEDLPQV